MINDEAAEPSLEEILSPVCHLQPEHMLLLAIIWSKFGERVMNSEDISRTLVQAILLEPILVLV